MFVAGVPDYQIKNTESFNIKTPTVEVDLDFVTKVEDVDNLPTTNTKYEVHVEKSKVKMGLSHSRICHYFDFLYPNQ
jgi:hypothetical protein